MNDLEGLKKDGLKEEMLDMMESMEQELNDKNSIIQQKNNVILTLQKQLDE